MSNKKQYSDEDLIFFKIQVEKKLEKTNKDLNFLLNQIEDISESKGNDGDLMDSTSSNIDLNMLYTMVNRHRNHVRDLENALIRIRQKTYGICVISGELIDKKRLMAVPTTTKSMKAKKSVSPEVNKKEADSSFGSEKDIIENSGKTGPKPDTTPLKTRDFVEENDYNFLEDEFLDEFNLDDSFLEDDLSSEI